MRAQLTRFSVCHGRLCRLAHVGGRAPTDRCWPAGQARSLRPGKRLVCAGRFKACPMLGCSTWLGCFYLLTKSVEFAYKVIFFMSFTGCDAHNFPLSLICRGFFELLSVDGFEILGHGLVSSRRRMTSIVSKEFVTCILDR